MLDYVYLDTTLGSTLLHQTGASRGLTDASGLIGIPGIRGDSYDLPDDDGAREPAAQHVTSNVFSVSGMIRGNPLEVAWLDWDVVAASIIACKDVLGTMRWQRVGGGAQRSRRVKLAGSLEPPLVVGAQVISYQATFRSPDPCAYGASTNSATIDPTIGALGGMTIPLVFPLDLGGGSSGGLTLSNAGNYPSRRVAYTLTGPWVSPSVTNSTTGKGITSTVSLAAAETLVVDCDARTVLYQGVDASGTITWRTSRWPVLGKGGNVIVAGGFPSAGSQLAVTYLDAYIS